MSVTDLLTYGRPKHKIRYNYTVVKERDMTPKGISTGRRTEYAENSYALAASVTTRPSIIIKVSRI